MHAPTYRKSVEQERERKRKNAVKLLRHMWLYRKSERKIWLETYDSDFEIPKNVILVAYEIYVEPTRVTIWCSAESKKNIFWARENQKISSAHSVPAFGIRRVIHNSYMKFTAAFCQRKAENGSCLRNRNLKQNNKRINKEGTATWKVSENKHKHASSKSWNFDSMIFFGA